jgi:regulator of protease activity HflC (stomatin/prohibitin superfamily)
MERNTQKNGILNLFLLIAAAAGTFGVSRYANILSGQVTAGFLVLGLLIAAASWFQMRLEERERLEKLEFDEVTRGGSASGTLFGEGDAESFPLRRARQQFERFFIPGITIGLVLLQAGGFWIAWRWLNRVGSPPPLHQPLMAMSLLGMMALIAFLLGRFATGLARLQGQRLLNPGASQLLLGAYLLALNVAAIAALQFGFPRADLFLARALAILLAFLAVENLLTLLLENYRPRVKGRVARLLYESRVVGLLSHPEGIFTTAAHALDYQFGFKVSDTWFYQFLQRSIAWLVMAQLAILAASTSLIYIQPGEQGILERFGRPVVGRDLLETGFHLKLPWPFERVHRYRTQEIQIFDIGFEHDEDGDEHGESAVLWTVSHYKEEFHLLVASRDAFEPTDAAGGGGVRTNANGTVTAKRAPPVNLLSVGLPVQYQLSDVRAWAYNYSNAGELLKQVATREVVRYLVGVDVNEIMSTARFAAAEELQRRIQARADELRLGVKILFVGLQDVHPPVQVGEAYEKVVGAKQRREADILRAQAYAIRTNSAANSDALRRRSSADSARLRKMAAAKASESLFTNQMAAYHASPEVYTQRAYLQTMAQKGAGARKFILMTTNKEEVLMLNMDDKLREDALFNMPLPAPKP